MEDRIVIRPVTWLLLVVGVIFGLVALVYFTVGAQHLPAFLPGHRAGSTETRPLYGLAMLGVALAAFVGAWLTTAPSATA